MWSGGVSEISKEGALLGPTFGCLIAKQFQALRYGDRFWYELPDLPSSFTLGKYLLAGTASDSDCVWGNLRL